MSLFLTIKSRRWTEEGFWKIFNIPEPKLTAKKRLHQGALLFSKDNQTRELIHIRLNTSSMFFTDSSGQGYISNIKWCKVESFVEQSENDSVYGFTVFKLNSHQDFFVATSEALDEWMGHLSKVGILTGFKHDYAKIKKLDSGKFGKVYLCEDSVSREQFAVKRLKKETFKDIKNLRQLYNEVSILRKLKHPNIIKLFKIYEDNATISLVLEYVPYGNLLSRIQKRIKFTPKEVMTFSKKLFETLRYLHSQKIIHRDLKPENILMASSISDCEFKLCDFGLACYVDKSLRNKSGSPGYIAPEILRGSSYSTKADIFSAGVIIYILTSGIPPFYSKQSEKVMKKNKDCKVSFSKNEFKGISPLSIQFINELLNPEPAFRPTSEQVLGHSWMHLACCSESGSMSCSTLNQDPSEKGIYSFNAWGDRF